MFAEEKARHLVPTAPLTPLLRLQRREIGLAAGIILGCCSFDYLASTYLATSSSLPPRTVPHPLPLKRNGAGGKRRQCRWWRRRPRRR